MKILACLAISTALVLPGCVSPRGTSASSGCHTTSASNPSADDEPNPETTDTSYPLRSLEPKEADLGSAMGFFITCENPAKDCPYIEDSGKSLIRLRAHCRDPNDSDPGVFDCSDSEDSFNSLGESGKYVIRPLGGGSGAFIAGNLVLTARHIISRHNVENSYFIMDAAFENPSQWTRAINEDNDKNETYIEIDSDYILKLGSKPVVGSDPPGPNEKVPDYIVYEVRSRGDKVIPHHEALCLHRGEINKETKIRVPGHPRMLPLLVAEGHVVRPGTEKQALQGYFDISGGMSGSPLVLASDLRAILGVNMGNTVAKMTGGGLSANDCNDPEKCLQDATPVAMMDVGSLPRSVMCPEAK